MKLTRIGVWSAAKVSAWAGVLYGVCVGLLYGNLFGGLLASLLGLGGATRDDVLVSHWATVAVWTGSCALLVGLVGLLHGLVGSLFLNLILRITGGLELEVDAHAE